MHVFQIFGSAFLLVSLATTPKRGPHQNTTSHRNMTSHQDSRRATPAISFEPWFPVSTTRVPATSHSQRTILSHMLRSTQRRSPIFRVFRSVGDRVQLTPRSAADAHRLTRARGGGVWGGLEVGDLWITQMAVVVQTVQRDPILVGR